MIPELLLPAGDLEKLEFAFQYGADAVYSGVPMLSLRARENKFNIATVREAVERAHELKKAIYLTVNIFPRNVKIPLLENAFKQMAALKPEAFIIADPGVVMLCREYCPEIPIHLSVQANNVNWASARFWHKQGVTRIILSREISLKEIAEIKEMNPTLELEFFVHGSICMAYSGRCLLSQYMSYRDANQGICAHSCRWEYKVHHAVDKNEIDEKTAEEKGYKSLDADFYLEEIQRPGTYFKVEEDVHGTYIMNSKDMCLIEYLKDLHDAGVCSFKIEGRNKTFYYAATVARAYRRAIDDMTAGKPFNPDLLTELAKTSNRGFIPGFLMNDPRGMAQEYEKRLSHQTHEFIGVVRKVHKEKGKNMAEVEVKGQMIPPFECEIMTPKKDMVLTVKNLWSTDHKALAAAHPGQKDHILIEVPDDVIVSSILRKKRLDITAPTC